MFLIAPKEESTGEAVMSVERARAMLPVWEEKYRLRPNAALALQLSCIYFTLGDGDRAMAAIEMLRNAVAKVPDQVSTEWKATIEFNYGMFLRGFGRMEEANQAILASWAMNSTSDFAAMAVAEEYLRAGDWEKAWPIHNASRGTVEGAAYACGLSNDCKFWDGREQPTHLMVINEGGAGDRINYTRYLPLLTERGIPWSFFCYDELASFYERLPWIGPERIIREHDKKEFCPPPSHWSTTFSLAGPLGITPATIPDYPTYFTPPESSFKIDNTNGLPIVGLSWNANELFQGGLKIRSLTEGQAMRLVCMTAHKINWINLQHKHKMPWPVMNVPFDTWEDTAVLMDRCDAVVSVDSGPLWMSLALGKQTAVALSACEDWKFTSEWGPHLTKYHNGPSSRVFDMENAIDQLVADIRAGIWPSTSKPPLAPSECSTTTRPDMALVQA